MLLAVHYFLRAFVVFFYTPYSPKHAMQMVVNVKRYLRTLRSRYLVLHSDYLDAATEVETTTQFQGVALPKSFLSKCTTICTNKLTLTITEPPFITLELHPKQAHLSFFQTSPKNRSTSTHLFIDGHPSCRWL